MYRPLRIECYKILFSGKKPYCDLNEFEIDKKVIGSAYDFNSQNESFLIEEIVFEPKAKLMKTVPISIRPLVQDCTVDILWGKSLKDRLEFLLRCLNSNKLISYFYENDRAIIKSHFDEHFIVPCLVLRYLLKYLILCSKDIDAFLTTFVWIARNPYNNKVNI